MKVKIALYLVGRKGITQNRKENDSLKLEFKLENSES